jgi:transposase
MQHSTIMPTLTQTLGVDLGDRHSNWCLIGANGEIQGEDRVATTRVALEQFFGRLDPCRVVLEACGHVHWIAKLAGAAGHEVIVANPREVRLISQSGRKNDRNDARTLARLGRVDPELLRPVKLRGEACRASRALLHARDQLVRMRTKLVTFTRGQVKSFGGRIPSCSAAAFHKRAAAHVPQPLQEVIKPVLEVLAQLESQIRTFDKRIVLIAEEQHPETAILRRVRGVGPVLALAYVATIEDPKRFSSSRTVGSYVGLTARLHDSCSKTPELPISKCGDRYLRRLLVNAATYILGPFGGDSDLRRFGQRIARGNSQRDRARARVAVARKLACLLHHLWRTGSVWDPNHAPSPGA